MGPDALKTSLKMLKGVFTFKAILIIIVIV